MDDLRRQTWLVVKPASFLWALEQVEEGRPAVEIMQICLDMAYGSMEELTPDE
jgi:hypothetical protein